MIKALVKEQRLDIIIGGGSILLLCHCQFMHSFLTLQIREMEWLRESISSKEE
jgi:hypothetical protein